MRVIILGGKYLQISFLLTKLKSPKTGYLDALLILKFLGKTCFYKFCTY